MVEGSCVSSIRVGRKQPPIQLECERQLLAQGFRPRLRIEPPGWHWPNFCFEVDQFIWILSGRAQLTVNDQMLDVAEGDGVLIPAGSVHSLKNTGSTSLVWLAGFRGEESRQGKDDLVREQFITENLRTRYEAECLKFDLVDEAGSASHPLLFQRPGEIRGDRIWPSRSPLRGRRWQIQWQENEAMLYRLYKQEKDRQNRTRLQALWLLRGGRLVKEVAQIVGVHYRTVQGWVAWYHQGGMKTVLGHRHGGHRNRKTGRTVQPEAAPANRWSYCELTADR